jgi:hypothetical protein
MALTTALGALLGYKSNTTAARTSTSDTTGSNSPVFSPEQSSMQSSLAASLSDRLKNGVNLAPMRTAGADTITKAYAGAGDQLSSTLAGRGFGNSGQLGTGMKDIAISQAGAKGNLEAQLQKYSLDEQDKTMSQAQSFAFASPGSSTTNDTTNVGAGSPFAGGLAGGLNSYLGSLNQAFAAMGAKP